MLITRSKGTESAARLSSANSSISGQVSPRSQSFETQFYEDKQKIRQLIRLCMNEDYLKASQEENDRAVKRNKATFKRVTKENDRNDDEFGVDD